MCDLAHKKVRKMLPDKFAINRTNWAFIIFGLVLLPSILVMEVFTFYQERKRFSLRKPTVRWRLPMLLVTIFGIVMIILDGLFEWIDWTNSPYGCENILSGLCTLFFIVMKQCVNLFLYDRAKIVHEALQLR